MMIENERRPRRGTRTRKELRLAAVLIWIGCLATLASAQTVRPLIAELGNPAKGRVEYVNDSFTPLNVVLEAKSFTVAENGEISYRALDPNIHLRLSATSFRLQPQQSFYVFYEASSDTAAPAWFVLYAAFSGFPFRTQQGMNVRLELPHTVYLLPKHSALDKGQVVVQRADFVAAEKKLVVEVENTSDNFGRVQQTLVSFGKKKQEAPGFPIFPHSKRVLEIPLDGDDAPDGISLQFPNFKIEEAVPVRSP